MDDPGSPFDTHLLELEKRKKEKKIMKFYLLIFYIDKMDWQI